MWAVASTVTLATCYSANERRSINVDVPAEGGHGAFTAEELEDAGEVVSATDALLELRIARRHRVGHLTRLTITCRPRDLSSPL